MENKNINQGEKMNKTAALKILNGCTGEKSFRELIYDSTVYEALVTVNSTIIEDDEAGFDGYDEMTLNEYWEACRGYKSNVPTASRWWE